MVILYNSNKNKSRYALQVHKEILDASGKYNKVEEERANRIIEMIEKDPLAILYKQPDTGDNAVHLLVGTGLPLQFILPILKAMIKISPESLEKENLEQSLPLHSALRIPTVLPQVVLKLLEKFPQAATHPDNQGFIPLFLCVMREDSNENIVREICKAYKEGPMYLSQSNNYPLHFACKRFSPNKEVLKILLRRFPNAAQQVNKEGKLPLHLLSEMTDDLEAIKLVYDAYPEALEVRDNYGRIPLHLAVLAVGKDHSNAVDEEIKQMKEEIKRKKNLMADQGNSNKKNKDEEELTPVNDDDDDDEDDDKIKINEMLEREGKSRKIIRFLVEKNYKTLVMKNNFDSTPVQTVLEKQKSSVSKYKIVKVYGLYDDPPTARLLLLLHSNYYKKIQYQLQMIEEQRKFSSLSLSNDTETEGNSSSSTLPLASFPNLTVKQHSILKDLNWLIRKDSLILSYAGEFRPNSVGALCLNEVVKLLEENPSLNLKETIKEVLSKNKKLILKDKESINLKNIKSNKEKENKINKEVKQEVELLQKQIELIFLADDSDIFYKNILARLRRRGQLHLVREIISFI